MERRGFLKALFGLPVAALVPFWSKPKVAWYGIMGYRTLNANWYCVLHPDNETAFRNISAKSEWKERWRSYRLSGGGEKSPKEIMASWEPFEFELTGEVGRYESIRFIG